MHSLKEEREAALYTRWKAQKHQHKIIVYSISNTSNASRHSYSFSKVHSFLYIFLCVYCLVFISLRKPRSNRYFSGAYFTVLWIWHICKISYVSSHMWEKVKKKIKNILTEKWEFHQFNFPGCPAGCQEDNKEEAVSFLQPRECLKECWRNLSFQSDWVKQFPSWLQSK